MKMKPSYSIEVGVGEALQVVDIAQHCDKTKLAIAEANALTYDMPYVLCDLERYFKGAEIEATDPIYIGGQLGHFAFRGLNGIFGLFAYARYVENSTHVDTGSGFVQKQHSNSFPVQGSAIKDMTAQHRSMAKLEIERLKAYACSKEKGGCFCSSNLCGKGSTQNTKLARSRGRNISKR